MKSTDRCIRTTLHASAVPPHLAVKVSTPPDVVEFYKGLNANCSGAGKYYTAAPKGYIKGEYLPPPTSDGSLETYANEEDKFSGVTYLFLEGGTNEIDITNAKFNGGRTKENRMAKKWAYLCQVECGPACEYTYNSVKSDNEEEKSTETNCGNVYVSGTYSSSLTVGASDDVIINGEIYPYGDKGGEPTGTATLGLIANNFVRIYHPVGETYPVKSQAAKTENPVGESEVCGKGVELTGKVTSGKVL